MLSGSYPITELADVKKRTEWTAAQLEKVKQSYADGFNLDIEDVTREGTNDSALLTAFVGEFYNQFKSANQNYQVSVLAAIHRGTCKHWRAISVHDNIDIHELCNLRYGPS